MAVAELFALKEQLARRRSPRTPADPARRSLAQTMRALRRSLRNLREIPPPGTNLLTQLRDAITDGYERRKSKRARYRPPNPDKKPLGDPPLRRLTPQEHHKLQALEEQLAC